MSPPVTLGTVVKYCAAGNVAITATLLMSRHPDKTGLFKNSVID